VEVIKTPGVAIQATNDVADKQAVSLHALNVCEPLGFLASTRKVRNAERPGRIATFSHAAGTLAAGIPHARYYHLCTSK
jgi:hypothetical protein